MAQYGIGLSALNAFSEAIDVTSNNIANGQTVGYKSAEYVFADQFFKAQNPQARDRAGMGTSRMIIRRANTYGTISGTQNPLDLAIAGPGMFVLAKQTTGANIPTEEPQKFQYTRNGQFAVDSENRIVNENGLFLVGYAADEATGTILADKTVLKFDTKKLEQVATRSSTLELNLDNRRESLGGRKFDRLDPASYSQSTSQTVYDDKGKSHTLSLFYKKVNSADLTLKDTGGTGTTFKFEVMQSLGTTLNGEQTNKIATNAVAHGSGSDGSTQTLNYVQSTYLSGGLEQSNGLKTLDKSTVVSSGTLIDGIYKNVALKGDVSNAEGAIATITVLGGAITKLEITKTGYGYSGSETVSGSFGNNWDFTVGIESLVQNIPSISKTDGSSAAPGTTEEASVTFEGLKAGQKLTIAGLTFTAGSSGATADQVAAAFAGLNSGDDGSTSGTTVGTFSGVLNGWNADVNSSGVVKFTSTTEDINVNDLYASVSGDGLLGAVYNLKLNDGTQLTAKRSSLGDQEDAYQVEVDRYAVFATLDTIPVGSDPNDSGTTSIALSGLPVGEQTSIGTMAFIAGKNLDSLSRDALGDPQYITQFNITASRGEGNGWSQTTNGGKVEFKLYSTNTTGYTTSEQTYTNSQDGSPASELTGYSFDSYGRLVAQYDNGKSVIKGQLVLATFNNFEGLIPVGGNGYQASASSGDPKLDKPNGSQMGAIRSQAIEESNVDLTQQLVRLMVLQRAYSAASQATKVQVATLVDDTLRIGQ